MWIKTQAKFRGTIEDVVWDSMDEDAQEEALELREFRFDTNELTAYNQSQYNGTTIRMKSGYEISIEMTVDELDEYLFKKESTSQINS